MYPQSSEGQTDVLAANEVATHVTLQQRQDSPHLYHLLGGFEVQDEESSPGREQVSCLDRFCTLRIPLFASIKSHSRC